PPGPDAALEGGVGTREPAEQSRSVERLVRPSRRVGEDADRRLREVARCAIERCSRHRDPEFARAEQSVQRMAGEPWRRPVRLAPVAEATVRLLAIEQD